MSETYGRSMRSRSQEVNEIQEVIRSWQSETSKTSGVGCFEGLKGQRYMGGQGGLEST